MKNKLQLDFDALASEHFTHNQMIKS